MDAYGIGGPDFFHLHPPTISNDFGEYSKNELAKKIKALASMAVRVHSDFDVYRALSIKRGTHGSRGSDARVSIRVKLQ